MDVLNKRKIAESGIDMAFSKTSMISDRYDFKYLGGHSRRAIRGALSKNPAIRTRTFYKIHRIALKSNQAYFQPHMVWSIKRKQPLFQLLAFHIGEKPDTLFEKHRDTDSAQWHKGP